MRPDSRWRVSRGVALLPFRKTALVRLYLIGTLVQGCFAQQEGLGQNIPRGSLIVFYGDSITRRGDESGGWIKIIRERLARDLGRRDLRLVNAGQCGATAEELAAMLQGEFPQRPQAAVVCIGVNDVLFRNGADPQSLTNYTDALAEIVDRLRRTGAEVIVMPPLLYGEAPRGSNSRDRELDAYAHAAALVAEKRGVRFVDARTAFFLNLEQTGANNGRSDPLTVDGLHLSSAGNRVLADVVYPELVSSVPAIKGRGAN
jgi:lysophospholipase L1-like esterase